MREDIVLHGDGREEKRSNGMRWELDDGGKERRVEEEEEEEEEESKDAFTQAIF